MSLVLNFNDIIKCFAPVFIGEFSDDQQQQHEHKTDDSSINPPNLSIWKWNDEFYFQERVIAHTFHTVFSQAILFYGPRS